SALKMLRELGLAVGQLDARDWNPAEKVVSLGRRSCTEAMCKAHQAVAHAEWLATTIQEAIDDPWPNLSHGDMMADMEADIVAFSGRLSWLKKAPFSVSNG